MNDAVTQFPPAETMPDDDFETSNAIPEYIYEERRGRYWHRRERGDYVDKSEPQLKRWLRQQGVRGTADPKANEVISPLEATLIESETERRVFYAGPLAGYKSGMHNMEGGEILVTRSPRLITPKPGEWPLLREVLDTMLSCPAEDIDQRPYFYGWLKHLMESLYEGWWTRGLALAMAGDVRCGKTLLLTVLKEMCGGGEAKPYRYMIGQDAFNEEMFEHTILSIDDESADTSIKARKHFAAQIKQVVANGSARCRGMHKSALTLKPIWRLVICLNMEPDNLMVLPPVDEDVADKMMLFRVYGGYDFPSGPAAERAFFQQLLSELPSFLHWLCNEWEMPADLVGRFGVRHFHHPALLQVLDEMAPFHRVDQLIHQSILKHHWRWEGTTTQLEHALKAEDSGLIRSDRDWIPQPAWLGRHLERLGKKLGPDRYRLERKASERIWHIYRADYPHDEK